MLIPDFVCKEINMLPSRFKRGALFLTRFGEPYLSGTELNVYFEEARTPRPMYVVAVVRICGDTPTRASGSPTGRLPDS